jgi:glycosyltransferase involved in cell wall biosynthesis
MGKINVRIEGVTVFNPWPPKRFDLVHAFNRIPLGTTPYLIGFESHLPRAYWMERTSYFEWLIGSLAGPRCRGIIAISEHARRVFSDIHGQHARFPELEAKLQVRLPNMVMPEDADLLADAPVEEIRLAFVGSHFARKGGLVGLRVAQLARERGLPISLDIVSGLHMGQDVWTDPTRPAFYDAYRVLLDLPNVRYHASAPNAEVHRLLARSHFHLLTTFSDTFGFSAIESMAHGTPVIGTRQGALPEFITDGVNGVLLNIETNPLGEWIYSAAPRRDQPAFEAMFSAEIERLAYETLAAAQAALADPGAYQTMRRQARADARRRFDHRSANQFWDDLYEKSVAA